MKTLHLGPPMENIPKVGTQCGDIEPNVFDDTKLMVDGQCIGFYIRNIEQYAPGAGNLIDIANLEFRSNRVPKQEMSRGPQGSKKDKAKRAIAGDALVTQYSTTLGSRAPKPHMRMPYPSRSMVHSKKSAKVFVQAMYALAKKCAKIYYDVEPALYEQQMKSVSDVPARWAFTDMYTSSISNFNISAAYHIDHANAPGSLNAIITKRNQSVGGCLHLPEYGLTFEQPDNSLLVYPAWRNIHGVTPIHGGYRNSFIFYAVRAFKGITI